MNYAALSASSMSGSAVIRENLLQEEHDTRRQLEGECCGSVFLGSWHGNQVAVKFLHPAAVRINDKGSATASPCVEDQSTVRPSCLQLCEELAELQLRYPAAVESQTSGDGTASDGVPTRFVDDEAALLRDQLHDVAIERYQLRPENDRVTAEKDAAMAEVENISSSLGATTVEQNGLFQVLVRVAAERDKAVSLSKQAVCDRDDMAAERDRLGIACQEAILERDKAVLDRDRLVQERDGALKELDRAISLC